MNTISIVLVPTYPIIYFLTCKFILTNYIA